MQWESIATGCAGVLAAVAISEQLAIAEVSGVISPEAWVRVAAAAHRALQRHQTEILIIKIDLSRAVLAVAEERINELVPGFTRAASSHGLPGALLVSETCEPMARRLAWGMAQHGIERAVFSDARACEAWLGERLVFELLRREARLAQAPQAAGQPPLLMAARARPAVPSRAARAPRWTMPAAARSRQ